MKRAADAAAQIEDNDIFTGREVKRLLAEVLRESSPYLKIRAASEITGIPQSTLKSAAPRYLEQMRRGDDPLIRVRRTSPAKGAHWLFHEGDCWAASRRPVMQPAENKTIADVSTDDEVVNFCVNQMLLRQRGRN